MEPPIVFSLIAMMLILFIVAVFMTFRYKQRELQHRERMLALEKGGTLPLLEDPSARNSLHPRTFLLRGMMWLFSGIGLMAFLLALSVSAQKDIPASVRVQNANYAKNSGATEEQIRMILNDTQERGLPPGFSLIGLIPMGVGLAYLLTYRKEKDLKTAS
jgi:hypothetical protein